MKKTRHAGDEGTVAFWLYMKALYKDEEQEYMRQARTRCNQCSQEYRDKQTGWTYHSTYRAFTCSKECSDILIQEKI